MPDCVSSASKPGTSSTCSDECCAAYYTACSMMQAKSHANSRAACHTACPLTKALQQAPAMLAMEKSATLRQQAHVLCIAVIQACYMQKEEHYKDTYVVCASTLSTKAEGARYVATTHTIPTTASNTPCRQHARRTAQQAAAADETGHRASTAMHTYIQQHMLHQPNNHTAMLQPNTNMHTGGPFPRPLSHIHTQGPQSYYYS